MDIILIVIATIIFGAYLRYVYINHGILSSISYSFVVVDKPILYILTMWGIAIPMIIVGSTVLTFLAGTGICFTAITASMSGDKTEKIIHRIGAEGGMLLAALSMWIDFGYWYLPIAFGIFTAASIKYKLKNHTWWIEVAAFVMVLLGLTMKSLF